MKIKSGIIILLIGFLTFSCNDRKIIKEYYDNGQVSEILPYKGDELDGKSKAYYENGQLRAEGEYKGGRFHGEWKHWYEDGKIMSKIIYKNGKVIDLEAWDKKSNKVITNCTGTATLTYPDGSPMSMATYKDCKMHGRWVTWHENGQIESEIFYENGKPVGEWKYWKEDGSLEKVEKQEFD